MAKKKKNKSKKINKQENIENIKKESSFIGYYIIIAVIIFIIFGLIYGLKILNPTYEEWTLAQGDIIQHHTGWEVYRNESWHFPIGLINDASYPTYVSIIYTDSIPILALFFKIISFILPKTFQYFGLYGLACYILQGIFSAKILKKYTDSKINIIIGSLIFTLIPSMMFRMFYHTALASQWLILLSLETIYLYNDYKDSNKIYYIWGIISLLTSTIHIYYLLMCGVILLGYLLLDILNTKKIKKSLILLLEYLIIALVSIWIFGGFTNLTESDNFGFGSFSYNLNGLFNPMHVPSIIPKLEYIPNQYEGFAYLGLGVITLMGVSLLLSLIWVIKDRKVLKENKNIIISLLFIVLISTLLAVSPKVYFGETLLFEIKLPEFINNLWGIFRSTGRLIWPVISIIMLSSIIILFKRLNWKYSLVIITLCFFVQVIDLGEYIMSENENYSDKIIMNPEYSLHKSETLKKVANNKDIELIVLASDDFFDSDKFLFADWIVDNNKKLTNFKFARNSFDTIIKENTKKYLNEKDEKKAYIFTFEEDCKKEGLYCYYLPMNYSLGYIKPLD
ncbi:MAG: hypothetical protein IJO57_04595 [Bacilli bacterium]|nr:hypothetical protein [Bacilli bacterium]